MPKTTRTLCLAIDALLVVGFFAGLLLPASLHLVVGGDGEGARMEYRKPAELPALAFDTKYPRAFEKYFDDNFALRTWLVRWHNRIKLFGLGSSPSPSFVVGEDGWLYYTGERVIENHVGELRLSRDELRQWQTVLEARRDWCAERGITYLFVIVPDKHAIYPEYLPSAYRHPERRTTYEQFMEHFGEHSDLRPLGLKDLLLAARETEEHLLYYRLGTHWNDLGAWLAYEAILRRLAPAFPRLAALERPDFVIDRTAKDDNFGSRLLLHEEMPQDIVSRRPLGPVNARLVAKKEPPVAVSVWELRGRPRAPRAVMFHDSQGDWLQPYLADTFARLTTVSKGAFDRDLIEREGAKVVIEEVGERRLWRVPRR
jgi:hypothetical protein